MASVGEQLRRVLGAREQVGGKRGSSARHAGARIVTP